MMSPYATLEKTQGKWCWSVVKGKRKQINHYYSASMMSGCYFGFLWQSLLHSTWDGGEGGVIGP